MEEDAIGRDGLSLAFDFCVRNSKKFHLGHSGDRNVRKDNTARLHRKNIRFWAGSTDSARSVPARRNLQIVLRWKR